MSLTELREFTRRVPFEPFRIKMSNGEYHDVHHPDMASASLTSVALTDKNDRLHLLAMEHILELELEPLAKGQKGKSATP